MSHKNDARACTPNVLFKALDTYQIQRPRKPHNVSRTRPAHSSKHPRFHVPLPLYLNLFAGITFFVTTVKLAVKCSVMPERVALNRVRVTRE